MALLDTRSETPWSLATSPMSLHLLRREIPKKEEAAVREREGEGKLMDKRIRILTIAMTVTRKKELTFLPHYHSAYLSLSNPLDKRTGQSSKID